MQLAGIRPSSARPPPVEFLLSHRIPLPKNALSKHEGGRIFLSAGRRAGHPEGRSFSRARIKFLDFVEFFPIGIGLRPSTRPMIADSGMRWPEF